MRRPHRSDPTPAATRPAATASAAAAAPTPGAAFAALLGAVAALTLALGLAANAAQADAKTKPEARAKAKPKKHQAKQARFQITVKGRQLTTWDYVKDQAPRCDWPEQERGTQTIEFKTPRSSKSFITFKRRGRGFVATSGTVLALADGELERHYDRWFSKISDCGDDPPPFGSGDPPADANGTAKCFTLGGVRLYFGDSRQSLYGDDPFQPMPPVGVKAKKGSILMRGGPYWGLLAGDDPSLPAACSASGEPDADIGIVESRGEWAGGLIEAAEKLSPRQLFDRRRKTITVHFGSVVSYPNEAQRYVGSPTTEGRTVLTAKMVLKRT